MTSNPTPKLNSRVGRKIKFKGDVESSKGRQ